MHATVGLVVILSVAALAPASPYYSPYPQQRQLFYPVQYPQPQYYTRQVYYAPPAAANLVAPVPAVRYPVVAPPAKSVVYYGAPALAPYPGLVYGGADEGAEGGNSVFEFFNNIAANFPPFPWGNGNNEAEAGTAPAAPEGGSGGSPAAPEKIEQGNSEEPAKEEENKDKENEAEKPDQPANAQKVKTAPKAPQKYVVVGQPQFFGAFAPQRVNPAAVLPSADHGAVSSYLLLKNYPGYRLAPQFPVVPQVPQIYQVPQQGHPAPQAPQPAQPPKAAEADAELIPAGQPGAAALGYQKLLKEAAAEAARQSKEYDDTESVEAATAQDKPESSESGDNEGSSGSSGSDDGEEAGPTIAQAKPKAIALAGPGGVASAAPVGTALVGPGGMAISAPEATAVAGAKGAASGVISPATQKTASKAHRTYQLATRNLQYLLSL